MTGFGFPIVLILWIAYAVIWIFSSGTLLEILRWVQRLPLILEIIVWIIFLPWVLSLWIWHSSWPLWLRVLLVTLIILGTLGGSASGASRSRARSRDRV